MPTIVERAPGTVAVAGLRFDRAPVTHARYAEFVEAEGHRPPASWPNGRCPDSLRDHPVVGVDYFDAVAFARFAGGCLPTEYEWVLASGLDEPRAYPWGDVFDNARCNTFRSGVKGTTPVGRYPAAPSGCVDLCGNVWELTCNEGPGATVLVKGGSWFDYPAHAKIDHSFTAPVAAASATVGFRLCYGRAERHPGFLDDGAVARAIDARRETPRSEPMPVPPPAAGVSLDPEGIRGALSRLDAVLPMSPERPRNREPSRLLATLARVERVFVEKRGVLLAAAALSVLLVATTLGAAVSGGTPARPRIERAAPVDPAPRPARRAKPRVVIRRTTPGDGRTRDALARAAAGETDPAKRRRLLYEVAVLDEKANGIGEPMALTVPPARGLVYVINRLGPREQRCLAELRRLGRVERLDVTVVYTGAEDFGSWLERKRGVLGRVFAVPDAGKSFAAAHGAKAARAVVGLRADGRAAFVLPGAPARARVEAQLVTLR